MKYMGLNELREAYLSFFESKGHLRLPSFSLVPQEDKSLLLINAGMAPLKKYFTGELTPPKKRVTTCQKCVRTLDIERVGKTARHGTYFEMLGNFSFGDYFKNEATAWAWEFCTKVLELPKDRLYVSIYENDDEAFDIWTKKVGVAPDHIVRLGKADNFWELGAGPCGPCSEIYFDRGEKYGCGKEGCAVGCDCDRFVEFWNNVFTQFSSDGAGNYTPLEHPNIDTGMGLERIACIMQGVDNLFEVDTIANIMKELCGIANVEYKKDPKTDESLRVITDHIRSSVFLIGDGVMPSNEGRGYVLRRLIRRAARHGRLIGLTEPFLYRLCERVIKENESAYPELCEKKEFITSLLRVEEDNFAKTVEDGLSLLEKFINETEGDTLSGKDAFLLSDTYGFPLDLTREILAEKGMSVNEQEFAEYLAEQKARARKARKGADTEGWADAGALKGLPKTEFTGYVNSSDSAKVLAIISDGKVVSSVSGSEDAVIVLDKTPFYAESGGQVADTGVLLKGEENAFTVTGVSKNGDGVFVHEGVCARGIIAVGDAVDAKINTERRTRIMRNHSCAHLIQAALRNVLGTHVEQAGSYVDEHRCRFDFTHFKAMTNEEIKAVEAQVNNSIMTAAQIDVNEMPIDEAKKLGAMALFGEKYGDTVRVVKMGDISVELCGGTHAANTGNIGLCKIVSENSVAAGVRRIEAVTGTNVIDYIEKSETNMKNVQSVLKVQSAADLVNRAAALVAEQKDAAKEIERLSAKIVELESGNLFSEFEQVGDAKLVTAFLGAVKADALRAAGDKIKSKDPDNIGVLAAVNEGKGTILVVCGENAKKKYNAGVIVKQLALLCGGGGGGRPDSAMAGAPNTDMIETALLKAKEIIANI